MLIAEFGGWPRSCSVRCMVSQLSPQPPPPFTAVIVALLTAALSACSGESGSDTGSAGPSAISPQPQPTPAQLPSVDFGRVSIRASGADELELTGDDGTLNDALRIANVERTDGLREVEVTSTHGFHVVVPGKLGDRLLFHPHRDTVFGQDELRGTAGGALSGVTDCLRAAGIIGAAGWPSSTSASFPVDNTCSGVVHLTPAVIPAGATASSIDIASNDSGNVVVNFTTPPTAVTLLLIRDDAGKTRLAAALEPSSPL